MCDVGYLCANFSLPRPLCSRPWSDVRDRQTDRRQTSDRRQTDRCQTKLSLNASALWGQRHKNRTRNVERVQKIEIHVSISWTVSLPEAIPLLVLFIRLTLAPSKSSKFVRSISSCPVSKQTNTQTKTSPPSPKETLTRNMHEPRPNTRTTLFSNWQQFRHLKNSVSYIAFCL